MAFQQPQRHQPRPRSYSSNLPEPVATTAPPAPQPQRQSPRQSPHDWIVFSPTAPSDTYDHTDSTIRTDRITGQLSDFGSLETAGLSEKPKQTTPPSPTHQRQHDKEATEADQDFGETEDADSLDDGLHAFNEPSLDSDQRVFIDQNGDSVLPTHDGLGMFPGSNLPVQEQFWLHEKYNPRRRRQSLRRSSLQRRFEALEEQAPQVSEDEKVQRIEKWRLEQSQAILEEIERETRRRRRRKSRASATRNQKTANSLTSTETASSPSKTTSSPAPSASHQRLSFWERLTRSVIRNLIGIDDATLEFIFGEALPSDAQAQPAEKRSPAAEFIDYAERTIPNDSTLTTSSDSWEQRLLSRISKELGMLLSHITEHPGAFTSYLRTQETPSYAGITTSNTASASHSFGSDGTLTSSLFKSSTATPSFGPTLLNQPHHRAHHHHRHSLNTTDPSLWGIEEEEDEDTPAPAKPAPISDEAARFQREREYWERDLDVNMVFGFLRDRFSSPTSTQPPASTQHQAMEGRQYAQPRPSSSRTYSSPLHQNISSTLSTLPNHSATNATSLRRAALIRHHHPLVSRNVPASSQTSQLQPRNRTFSSATPLSPILGRRPSWAADTESCASQSTKRSKTAHSSSSRNYWDIGGSGGGGSLGGGTLGWGEVL